MSTKIEMDENWAVEKCHNMVGTQRDTQAHDDGLFWGLSKSEMVEDVRWKHNDEWLGGWVGILHFT